VDVLEVKELNREIAVEEMYLLEVTGVGKSNKTKDCYLCV